MIAEADHTFVLRSVDSRLDPPRVCPSLTSTLISTSRSATRLCSIALYAIERGHHVLVTKPATQTLADHTDLIKAAEKHGVYVCVEMHKRFDPTYADGKQKVSFGVRSARLLLASADESRLAL